MKNFSNDLIIEKSNCIYLEVKRLKALGFVLKQRGGTRLCIFRFICCAIKPVSWSENTFESDEELPFFGVTENSKLENFSWQLYYR